jgi:hypothetical protein
MGLYSGSMGSRRKRVYDAFYRHTRYLAQYQAPAGDLLINPAVELLDRLAPAHRAASGAA